MNEALQDQPRERHLRHEQGDDRQAPCIGRLLPEIEGLDGQGW